MAHPADTNAWKALDAFDSSFADEVRNVHLGLAMDGFSPFNLTTPFYSRWSVFVVPNNLPLALCMKYEFIFLCLVIPGPGHPGTKIDVMMRTRIEELKILWEGVKAYDCYKKQKFTLRAAFLWSIHDFMAYVIFAGWSCHGVTICPICAGDTLCF
jgi:hypothetical protein